MCIPYSLNPVPIPSHTHSILYPCHPLLTLSLDSISCTNSLTHFLLYPLPFIPYQSCSHSISYSLNPVPTPCNIHLIPYLLQPYPLRPVPTRCQTHCILYPLHPILTLSSPSSILFGQRPQRADVL